MTKTLGDFNFKFVEEIRPLTVNGKIKNYNYKNRENTLDKYKDFVFCDLKICNLTSVSGVYAIFTDEQLVYVGCTKNLVARWGKRNYAHISPYNCTKKGQHTNVKINNYIYESSLNGSKIDLYVFETKDYKTVEKQLRNLYQLPLNSF